MRLKVLGSGTVCPSPDRNGSGYLVEAGGQRLVMDMGPGTVRSLLATGLEPWALDALFLTHIHPDHTADLVAYFFALNYALGWQQRTRPLPVYGPKGFARFLKHLEQAWPWAGAKQWEREVHELGDRQLVQVGEVQIKAFQVEHGDVEALSFRLEAGGRKLCYSGDSCLCPGLEASAQGVDLFLCECAIPRGYPQKGGHMLSDDVGVLAARAGVGRVVLTHIYPHGINLAAQVRDHYPGPVDSTVDGAEYEV